MTKEEYKQWLESEVTQECAKAIYEVAEDIIEVLQFRGNSRDDDMYYKGFLEGIKQLQNWKPRLEEEEENGIEDQGSRIQSYS